MKSRFLSFFKPAAAAESVSPRPDSAEAHYRRANVLKDQGAWEAALAEYDRAIALKPDYAHAFCNRAVALGQMRMLPEAVASYDRAIALDPTDALARYNRGMLMNGMGQKDAALESFNNAIASNANFSPAHFARAALLQEQKQWAASLASYDRAITLNAGDAAAHYNRGTVLKELEQWAEALGSYDRAIALNGKFASAHAARAETLQQLNRLPEALRSYDRAIELHPDEAIHYDGRGVLLHKMGRFADALASYNQAIATNPSYPQAYFNRGTAQAKLRNFDGALTSYNLAIAKKPGFADFHFNLALASLKVGDFVNGWAHYEWRWRIKNGPILLQQRQFRQPLWLGGDDISGRTILLYGEQGLGDSLLFCRYCTLVARLGARVILEVPGPLVRLCATLEGVTRVIPYGDPLPDFDVQCPLMSLPLACKTTLETIPSATRYLNGDPHKVAAWQERLGAKTGPRVGLTWSGSQGARMHSERSYPLEKLVPYLADKFQYFCLQTEITATDRKTLMENPAIRQFDGELRDFSDTAALCECLDLVISMDTSVVHLNGALGRKTWVLLPFDSDWKWLIDREDSPWYPAVRLFRQTSRGDWNDVFERIAAQLHREFVRD
jgi:tetratricopeptide (TPR) repeat protein